MHLRVAEAEHPAGPFIDQGRRLTQEDFAIDAHVFEDEDGSRYLFYATDFLDRDRVGTGTVMDRLVDPYTLAGSPTPVSLPAYDWQIFDPKRAEKGNLRWHTIEGSYTLKHKGRYYQMFSGGNYQNLSYGVGYAVTDNLSSCEEWRQVVNGETTLPILKTVPEKVFGPGHNSVVMGPDYRQWFCVYHVIQSTQPLVRVMAVDRLEWCGDRILVLGPSHTPQPQPIQPENPLAWKVKLTGTGQWRFDHRSARQTSQNGTAEAQFTLPGPYFLFNTDWRLMEGNGVWGVCLKSQDGEVLLRWHLSAIDQSVGITWTDAAATTQQIRIPLQKNLDLTHYHHLWVEVNGQQASLRLNRSDALWQGNLSQPPALLALFTQAAAMEFTALALTQGWEDLFMDSETPLERIGWHAAGGNWRVENGRLTGTASGQTAARLIKEPRWENYELVINARVTPGSDAATGFGFYPALYSEDGMWVRLETAEQGYQFTVESGEGQAHFYLPPAFDPTQFHHFRFLKTGSSLRFYLEKHLLGIFIVPEGKSGAALSVQNGSAEFDMVRLTALSGE